MMNATTTKYGRTDFSLSIETMPRRVNTTITTGVSNVSPNATNIVSTKPK